MLAAGFSGVARGQPEIHDIFQSALACALVEPLLADMPVEPVYVVENAECIDTVPDDNRGRRYFQDAACLTPLRFEPTSLTSHCNLLLDSSQLGEAFGEPAEPVWTLSPGTRLDLGARALSGVSQPYMQRHVYRSIETAAGTCNLEMRVYTSHPLSVAKRSLLALHGGSWSSRGFGFFGLELTLPHYTDEGFVAFVPFYRLLEDSDGSAACHNATIDEIVDDAEAALQWVRDHAESFGSDPKPVVFGQSAGAHLALSLAINQPSDVAGGVLFYPPTDFTDFALRAQSGLYDNAQGLGILNSVIGVSAADANINASPIPQNSFPVRIVESDLAPPPLRIVHGVDDGLVEFRQSVRLCDALARRELLGLTAGIAAPTALREVIQCGLQSQLQIIKEGQHALDVCLADIPLATDLCPSGSSASRQEVSVAIAEAVDFALSVATQEPSAPLESSSGAGNFSPLVSVSLMLMALLRRFRCINRHGT